MRKLIKLTIITNIIVWIATVIGWIVAYRTGQMWAIVIAFLLGVTSMFINLVVSLSLTQSGLDRDWFKTQEELQKTLEEKKHINTKLTKVIHVIGDHEAVKLWEANKDKEDGKE